MVSTNVMISVNTDKRKSRRANAALTTSKSILGERITTTVGAQREYFSRRSREELNTSL